MRILALVALCTATVAAIPTNPQRIVGGTLTTIDQYPSMAVGLQLVEWSVYHPWCAGTILNNRSVLTAAHCFYEGAVSMYAIRVGSSWTLGGGIVHKVNGIIHHPLYYPPSIDHDLSILRIATNIKYNDYTRPAPIAGTTYVVPDNDYIWAAGWGGPEPEDLSELGWLRHVKLMKVNLDVCNKLYDPDNYWPPMEAMICLGWPTWDRSQYFGDSGSPIFHNGVVVGVCSAGEVGFPDINIRVANYTNWIVDNA